MLQDMHHIMHYIVHTVVCFVIQTIQTVCAIIILWSKIYYLLKNVLQHLHIIIRCNKCYSTIVTIYSICNATYVLNYYIM